MNSPMTITHHGGPVAPTAHSEGGLIKRADISFSRSSELTLDRVVLNANRYLSGGSAEVQGGPFPNVLNNPQVERAGFFTITDAGGARSTVTFFTNKADREPKLVFVHRSWDDQVHVMVNDDDDTLERVLQATEASPQERLSADHLQNITSLANGPKKLTAEAWFNGNKIIRSFGQQEVHFVAPQFAWLGGAPARRPDSFE